MAVHIVVIDENKLRRVMEGLLIFRGLVEWTKDRRGDEQQEWKKMARCRKGSSRGEGTWRKTFCKKKMLRIQKISCIFAA